MPSACHRPRRRASPTGRSSSGLERPKERKLPEVDEPVLCSGRGQGQAVRREGQIAGPPFVACVDAPGAALIPGVDVSDRDLPFRPPRTRQQPAVEGEAQWPRCRDKTS